jgi:hypothetical protein
MVVAKQVQAEWLHQLLRLIFERDKRLVLQRFYQLKTTPSDD